MSTEKLLDNLDKLLKLHQSLYELATRKTEILKKGDIEALSSIMKDENKHIMAITKLEEERKQQVVRLVSGHSFSGEEPTLADVIEAVSVEDGEKLGMVRNQLAILIEELKKLNTLNQELVHSSLQFVNYSMDLVMPRPQAINYNKPTSKGQPEQVKRSVFDSKA
jgi:flagellar biosynthesis/type III secretory pathway chaperone